MGNCDLVSVLVVVCVVIIVGISLHDAPAEGDGESVGTRLRCK